MQTAEQEREQIAQRISTVSKLLQPQSHFLGADLFQDTFMDLDDFLLRGNLSEELMFETLRERNALAGCLLGVFSGYIHLREIDTPDRTDHMFKGSFRFKAESEVRQLVKVVGSDNHLSISVCPNVRLTGQETKTAINYRLHIPKDLQPDRQIGYYAYLGSTQVDRLLHKVGLGYLSKGVLKTKNHLHVKGLQSNEFRHVAYTGPDFQTAYERFANFSEQIVDKLVSGFSRQQQQAQLGTEA